MLNPLLLVPQNVTAFPARAFKEVIKLDGVIRVHFNPVWLAFFKKEEIASQTTQKEKLMRAQWEVGHLQAEERGFLENQICQHLDVGLLASAVWENKFLLLKLRSLWYFLWES